MKSTFKIVENFQKVTWIRIIDVNPEKSVFWVWYGPYLWV